MATLTLKNVPDDLHDRLKTQAAAHRRSLNQEAIECLDRLPAGRRSGEEQIRAIREFQKSLGKSYAFTNEQIDRWKREGRE